MRKKKKGMRRKERKAQPMGRHVPSSGFPEGKGRKSRGANPAKRKTRGLTATRGGDGEREPLPKERPSTGRRNGAAEGPGWGEGWKYSLGNPEEMQEAATGPC